MFRIRPTALVLACTFALGASAAGAAPDWRVVAADTDSGLSIPPLLPSAVGFDLEWASLASGGNGALGFARNAGSAAPFSLWAERNGTLTPIAENMATGATGPGRSGGEAGHVFRTLFQKQDSSGQAHRVFGARAGEPTQPADAATYGVWMWTGSANAEIARLNTEGALGPGLGAGIVFTNLGTTTSTGYPRARALPGQRVLIDATVTGSLHAVILHQGGVGNRACLLEGSSEPAHAPGIGSAVFYDSGSYTIDMPVVGSRGEVYVAAAFRESGTNGRGIFSLCRGAPQVQARAAVTGSLGPGMNDTSYTFSEFGAIRPAHRDAFYFWARVSSPAGSTNGGFLHADGQNAPVYLYNVEGSLGPGYSGYVFNATGAPTELAAAGRYGLLRTTIKPIAGTSSTAGVWRLMPGLPPEPIAIVGDTGSYAAAPGRPWREFHRTQVLDSGEVLIFGEVGNPNERGIWRLRPGAAPVRELGPGDLVKVPTASGVVERAVTSVTTSGLIDTNYLGEDGWASSNGDVLVRVNVQGIGTLAQLYLRGSAGVSESLLAEGFD